MNKFYFPCLIIVLISFSGCSRNNSDVDLAKTNATINVELNENSELIFDGQPVDINNISKLINKRIIDLSSDGVPKDEITVSLKADKTVKMDLIYDLQDELRLLQVRKVDY